MHHHYIMRQTSFFLFAIIPAVSAKMFPQINHWSAFVTQRVRRTYRPSIPAFSAVSFIFQHSSFRHFNLFSTSADVNLDTLIAHTEQNPPSALHTVVVHRNKQSMSFREGTPLVFTKSIAATYSEVLDDSVGEFDGERDVYDSVACATLHIWSGA